MATQIPQDYESWVRMVAHPLVQMGAELFMKIEQLEKEVKLGLSDIDGVELRVAHLERVVEGEGEECERTPEEA